MSPSERQRRTTPRSFARFEVRGSRIEPETPHLDVAVVVPCFPSPVQPVVRRKEPNNPERFPEFDDLRAIDRWIAARQAVYSFGTTRRVFRPRPPFQENDMARQFFVNLPVRDVAKSVAFFTALGFEFDSKFAGEHGVGMIVNDATLVMLVAEPFFDTFTKRERCDTRTHEEALFAFSVPNRSDVDEIVAKAVALGGVDASPAEDHGFMYDHGFFDLDGHGWNVVWMNPSA